VKIQELKAVIRAVFLLCVVVPTLSAAQTFTILASFSPEDGTSVSGPLVQGPQGDFYTTMSMGGNGGPCLQGYSGCGTIVRITRRGGITKLHDFNGTDGAFPRGPLLLGTDGSFYGVTYGGGPGGAFYSTGLGTVFKMTPCGKLTTLHNFNGTDGANPTGLVQAGDGSFYGMTSFGGANNKCGSLGCGTIFKMTAKGVVTTLQSFDVSDGWYPATNLVMGNDGYLYGTTLFAEPTTAGTFFRLTLAGALKTLYRFAPGNDAPASTIVQAANGNFYGTTPGSSGAYEGTVFEITPDGIFNQLYVFNGTNGEYPGGIVQATNGKFYGVVGTNATSTNCPFGCSMIYEITSQGVLTPIYQLDRPNGTASTELLQATDGNFYGVTSGTSTQTENGAVYRLSTGLGPFVTTLPSRGRVGTKVTILGTDLTGATSVTFNGIEAPFRVLSATEVETAVPVSATTGNVKVTTPRGPLSSNTVFRVP
jgi:uncharacterized repeat protein (TIGR03803 family)